MENSWWSSPFGLWASNHFITHRAHLKPFDHVTSEAAVFMGVAAHTGGWDREQRHPALHTPCRWRKTTPKTTKIKKKKRFKKKKSETTAGRRLLILLVCVTRTQQVSMLLSGWLYLGPCEWLLHSTKLSARTPDLWLFNWQLPRLCRSKPNEGLCSARWAALT